VKKIVNTIAPVAILINGVLMILGAVIMLLFRPGLYRWEAGIKSVQLVKDTNFRT